MYQPELLCFLQSDIVRVRGYPTTTMGAGGFLESQALKSLGNASSADKKLQMGKQEQWP